MAELVEFVHGGAAKITPRVLQKIYKELPLLKLQFAQIEAPHCPHLEAQLQFLANVVEDFADGKADEIPYVTLAGACFAIIYSRRVFDLIPDPLPEIGRVDDSAVVRVVLIEHEKVLVRYAEKLGQNWQTITVEP